MPDPSPIRDRADDRAPRPETDGDRGARYQGSFAQDLVRGLRAVDFGDRIIIFGACLLVSVLPLIIVLSAYASHHVEDDIARHLGLSAQGDRIVEGYTDAFRDRLRCGGTQFPLILETSLAALGCLSGNDVGHAVPAAHHVDETAPARPAGVCSSPLRCGRVARWNS